MDFVRNYLVMNETLGSCPFLSPKFSCDQNIEETLTQCEKSVSPMFFWSRFNFVAGVKPLLPATT